ncbi:unnamed protein product, partial [Mesorhabditis spiculigera]
MERRSQQGGSTQLTTHIRRLTIEDEALLKAERERVAAANRVDADSRNAAEAANIEQLGNDSEKILEDVERIARGEGACNFKSDQLVDMLKKRDDDFKEMSKGRQVSADARFLLAQTAYVQTRLTNFQETTEAHLQHDIFAAKLTSFTKDVANAPPTADRIRAPINPLLATDSEDEDDDVLVWQPKTQSTQKRRPRASLFNGKQLACIGRSFPLFYIPTKLVGLRPLFSNKAIAPTAAKVKKEKKKEAAVAGQKAKAQRVVLEQKTEGENQGEDQSLMIELQFILKSLMRYLKANKVRSVGYYEFVVDPDSYTRTVENMFHMAFILRDLRVRYQINQETGTPEIWHVPEDQLKTLREQNKKGKVPSHQSVFAMTKNDWKDVIEKLNITKPMITPMELRGAEVAVPEAPLRPIVNRQAAIVDRKPSLSQLKASQPDSQTDRKPTREQLDAHNENEPRRLKKKPALDDDESDEGDAGTVKRARHE